MSDEWSERDALIMEPGSVCWVDRESEGDNRDGWPGVFGAVESCAEQAK